MVYDKIIYCKMVWDEELGEYFIVFFLFMDKMTGEPGHDVKLD